MPSYLDLSNWPRREHFAFFKGYDHPFFNICAPVDVTNLRAFVKRKGFSFFIACHYLSTRTGNEIECFRYRLRGEQVLVHERINCGAIVLTNDERFTFTYFDYDEDFPRFHAHAQAVIAQTLAGDGNLRPHTETDDLLHHSVLPWLSFTSLSHARRHDRDDSVPKISIGKVTTENGRAQMPVSVEVHHALMDGLHVGRYFERFAAYCAAPEQTIHFKKKN